MIDGLVLAGGRSRRFGRDKASADWQGAPLLAPAARVLAGGCRRVAVGAAPGSAAALAAAGLGLRVLPDPAGLEGPLAGVLAGLAWAEAGGASLLATLPCDVPLAPPDLVARLAQGLGEAPAAAARAERAHPLCAVWRTSLAGDLAAFLGHGHPPVRAFLQRIGGVEVDFPDERAFHNVNTPGDLAQISEAPCA